MLMTIAIILVVLWLLGIPVASNFEGRPRRDLLLPARADERPVGCGAAAVGSNQCGASPFGHTDNLAFHS